jgi:hypothetical protein
MIKFGNLEKLSLRDVWPNEARDFTPWLAKNINSLGEALGLELELAEQEAAVGEFSLDLLATEVGSGRHVVIENQLNGTDHDHLGKLLTYASGYDASVIIWIAESFRDEHRQTMDWLNRRTDSETEFFGLVLEVFKIDVSDPAFKFNPVVFPSDWQKNRGRRSSGEISEKNEAYREFFQGLLDELRDKHHFTNARRGQPQSWCIFSSGYSKLVYEVSFAQGGRLRTGLYIDIGEAEINKSLFELIASDKEKIEAEMGESLSWERLDDKRASRIAIYIPGVIDSDGKTKNELKDWAIEMLLKFKNVLGGRLRGYLEKAL